MNNLKNTLRRWTGYFMRGRCGLDELGRTALALCGILAFVSIFTKGLIKSAVKLTSVGLLVLSGVRALSKDLAIRRVENSRFLALTERFRKKATLTRIRLTQGGRYRFYTCPGCKAQLRIPRGKGRVTITCPKCGETFRGRS